MNTAMVLFRLAETTKRCRLEAKSLETGANWSGTDFCYLSGWLGFAKCRMDFTHMSF